MNTLRILSTKKLSPESRTLLPREWDLTEAAFIQIRNTPEEQILQGLDQIAGNQLDFIFTSQHAVKAVSGLAERILSTGGRVYCLSGATSHAVQDLIPRAHIAEAARHSEDLAKIIIAEQVKRVVFFCGNRRLDNLPSLLKDASVQVEEVVVYDTLLDPKKVEGGFDVVMFFSPTGAESFFASNRLETDTICVAIGDTTASEIKKYTGNQVIVSKEPSQEAMINTLKEYRDKLKLNDVKE